MVKAAANSSSNNSSISNSIQTCRFSWYQEGLQGRCNPVWLVCRCKGRCPCMVCKAKCRTCQVTCLKDMGTNQLCQEIKAKATVLKGPGMEMPKEVLAARQQGDAILSPSKVEPAGAVQAAQGDLI
mmetsp:Transcript_48180/g.105079  ORF Transcript_48180/g.105079 Transcript_48180/m.105079 type:complete len:126 (+) Transcript_48180:677-1054(+)